MKKAFLFYMLVIMQYMMAAKKILVVIDRYPWYTKTIITHQIKALTNAGFDVSIYSKKRPNQETANLLIQQYNINEKIYYEKIPQDLKLYDAIICQYGNLGKDFIKIKRAKNLKAKIITCFRGSDITASSRITPEYYDELFEYGDLFLPVCAYYKYRLEILGCNPDKIVIIPSGIDSQMFLSTMPTVKEQGKIKIVSVSRLSQAKGIKYAIRAIAALHKYYPALEYNIIGDGIEKNSLQQLASELQASSFISFLGWQCQEQVARLLLESDIFVLPSITREDGVQEGIPNVLKEAMLAGLPVVATYHAGTYEIIEQGVTGVMVPERDTSSLIRAIISILQNRDYWTKQGLYSSVMIKNKFDVARVNLQFIEVIKRIFSNR